MFWYWRYIFIASSLRRISFISKPLCIKSRGCQVKWFALSVIVFASSCKQAYEPNIKPQQTNYLVVEGFINSQGFTQITLSRTLPVKDSSPLKRELSAQINIEGEDNSGFKVREQGNGIYTSDSLILNTNQKYRLHINTASGEEYLSDFKAVKITPLIDSINWRLEDGGTRIYVNTHDPQNNTRYYKWDYEETWEIHSAYVNRCQYIEGQVKGRDPNEVDGLYYCWRSQKSASIILGSTAQLANDVLSMAPVMFVPDSSEKTSVRYSILIKQYSLDHDAYDFYKMMKNNTESIGSVFGPLPSEITGNITCVSNPLEKVIGYITVSAANEKRVFISRSDTHSTYSADCVSIKVKNNPDSFKVYFESDGLLPYQGDADFFPNYYYSSSPYCIDCTLRGTNVKPSFW